MGFFNKFFGSTGADLYSGGDGGGYDTAVVINTTSTLIGVPAEYRWLENKQGKQNISWSIISQTQCTLFGQFHYDVIKIKLSNGDSKLYYFDITKFYGKM